MTTKPQRQKAVRLLESHCDDGTTRWIEVAPAYDFTDYKPENYGIHGMEWLFGISRGGIAVTWTLMTSWFLPQTRKRLERSHGLHSNGYDDGLGDVWYHSPVALYEDQSESHSDCKYTGGRCFSDGSGLASEDFFNKLVTDGDVWPLMLERLEDTERRVAAQKEAERNYS